MIAIGAKENWAEELEHFPAQNLPYQSFYLKAILNLLGTTQVVSDK